MIFDQLTSKIIAAVYRVFNELGWGFLEKVYENALCIELEYGGLQVRQQVPLTVVYRKKQVGSFFADLLVEEKVILELKAQRELAKQDEMQLVNYLKATGFQTGLLINFSNSVTIKRKYNNGKGIEGVLQ